MADTPTRENESTIIGADTHVKGELTFERRVKVDGRFEGQITGQGELHVTENATCKADVEASSVIVDGRIEGNLRVKDTVRLNNTGVVKGDIVAAKMVMSEGASFFGQCAVGPDAVKGGHDTASAATSSTNGNGDHAASQESTPPQSQRGPATAPGQAPRGGRTQPQYQRA